MWLVVGGWRSEVDGCRLMAVGWQLAGDDTHVSCLKLLHLITVRISQQLLRRRARRLSSFRKKDLGRKKQGGFEIVEIVEIVGRVGRMQSVCETCKTCETRDE